MKSNITQSSLIDFIQNIYPKILNNNFEDEWESYKYILIRGIVNILKKMIKEHSIELSTSDLKLLEEIIKPDKDNDDKGNKDKKRRKNDNDNKKVGFDSNHV